MEDVNSINVELEFLLEELYDINQLVMYISFSIFLFLIYYVISCFSYYMWNKRYILRYKLNFNFIEFLIPLWRHYIFLLIIRTHNRRLSNKMIVFYIILCLLCFINFYFLLLLHLYVVYIQGKVYKVYLINKNFIYIHYFSLGFLTPFLLWKER